MAGQDRKAEESSRSEWELQVRMGLQACDLTVVELAQRIGVPHKTLHSWLRGGANPDVRKIGDIAREIGTTDRALFAALGWLRPDVADRTVARLDWLRSQMQEQLALISTQVQTSGAAILADRLLAKGYNVDLTGVWQGRCPEYRTLFATEVRPSWTDAVKHDSDATSDIDAQVLSPRLERVIAEYFPEHRSKILRDRLTIQHELQDDFDAVNAYWIERFLANRTGPGKTEPPDWRSLLRIHVPELLATRPQSMNPVALKVKASLLVAGLPWCGGPDAAALVARWLGWGFTTTSHVVREQLRINPDKSDASEQAHKRAQVRVAERLLTDPTEVNRPLCWAFNDVDPMLTVLDRVDLGEAGPLVVILTPSKDLLDLITKQQKNHVAADESPRRILRLLDAATARLDEKRTLKIDVDLPNLEQDPPGYDARFDKYVEIAAKVADWLYREHEAPNPHEEEGDDNWALRTAARSLWRSS